MDEVDTRQDTVLSAAKKERVKGLRNGVEYDVKQRLLQCKGNAVAEMEKKKSKTEKSAFRTKGNDLFILFFCC